MESNIHKGIFFVPNFGNNRINDFFSDADGKSREPARQKRIENDADKNTDREMRPLFSRDQIEMSGFRFGLVGIEIKTQKEIEFTERFFCPPVFVITGNKEYDDDSDKNSDSDG